MRIGILVPHIFMQDAVLPNVIFAPANLAITLSENLHQQGHKVTLFTPGTVTTSVNNVTADLSLFEAELKTRGDDYISLLRKHAFTFITLARQVQSELIAKAMKMANDNQIDILHVYTNEEDTALPFATLCDNPVVFTHHDPLNFLVKYKSLFPKYPHYNWISISLSQRQQMPKNTNWVANVYHGIPKNQYKPVYNQDQRYFAYLGRIINTKGVHLAIMAVQEFNKRNKANFRLKIAGKHYSEHPKDKYWKEAIEPELDKNGIEYVGFLKTVQQKQEFLGNAKALIVPSLFEEPFGLVIIESLACGTPVVGLDSGALPEIIINGKSGYIVHKQETDKKTAVELADALKNIDNIDRHTCRKEFDKRFTADRMASEYIKAYKTVLQNN